MRHERFVIPDRVGEPVESRYRGFMLTRHFGLALVALFSLGCSGEDASDPSGGSGGSSTGGTSGSGATAGTGGSGGGIGGSGGGIGGSGGAPPVTCNDDCHFVRAGATGSGTDWDDAFGELPDSLVRGHVYFVAQGSYASYTFDDPASGGDTIRIVRATSADHGTDTGWQVTYADGEASFGPLSIQTPDYDIDGRGATHVIGDFQGDVVSIDASRVAVRGLDVDGAFALTGGSHTDGACTGMSVHGDDVYVEGNRIHDAADDGVSITNSTGVHFNGNRVYALHGCGTDGGCGPCYNGHSDGLEIYDLADSEFVGNMAYDIASTSTFFFGNWADELGDGPNEYCKNILVANNLLYNARHRLRDVRGRRRGRAALQ